MPEFNVLASTTENTVASNYEPVKQKSDAYQSEADLEAEFIRMLQAQGYEYLRIHQEQDLIDNLRKQLEKLNKTSFTDAEWQELFSTVIANKQEGIIEKTRKIQEDYIHNLKREDGSTSNIWLIDKKHPQNNSLQVLNQYENGVSEGARRDTRYDVTILVNGLPLVHVELKRRGVPIREAFNQIERYQRDSFWAGSGLYEYVQIFVISNGSTTKYYSNTTRAGVTSAKGKSSKKASNSFEFTSYWTDAENHTLADLVDFTKTFFSRHSLLNILTRYCILTSENVLMVMRPYQITACERIINRIETSSYYKKWGTIKGGGYIWHTTGSGKTLTSFKTARLASDLPDIDKVLFVVDRKDLDYQTMKEYDSFEKGAANSNTSTRVLTTQLSDANARIIITTIQKLAEFIKRNPKHEVYNKHVVLIFDECHRSQFGDMHAAIVKSFKKYHIFGFTGTPIMAAHPNTQGNASFLTTEQTFGTRLHHYTIINAINDKNVLPFKVDYLKTFDEDDAIKDEEVQAIDYDKIWHNPKRIAGITTYILDHFDEKTRRTNEVYTFSSLQNVADVVNSKKTSVAQQFKKISTSGFNAMFAVGDVEAAKQYYAEFKRQLAARPQNQIKVATIYSYAPNETVQDEVLEDENPENANQLPQASRDFLDAAIQDYNQMFGTSYDTSAEKFQNYYKDVSMRMKNKELDLLIVVNMFLTGFDAKTLNTLWVDKNLKLHGLIQAFSRTNRILNSVKTHGNIICFRNLQKHVDEALSMYGDTEANGVVLIHSFEDYYKGFVDNAGKDQPGYQDIVEELLLNFPEPKPMVTMPTDKEKLLFAKLFGSLLRVRNILLSFDEFKGKEIISPRDLQNYTSTYLEIREYFSKQVERKDVSGDVVFEVELITHSEINIDYILYLVQRYHDQHMESGELVSKIVEIVKAQPEMRSKRKLIEDFIKQTSASDDLTQEWKAYIEIQKAQALDNLINEEKLKPAQTKAFMKECFENQEFKTTGTKIDELLPAMSLFGSGGAKRAEKKARVIAKLSEIYNRFYNL